jgi:hypothetical protein
MSNSKTTYYFISGYFKESEMCFYNYIATTDGSYDYENCPYPFDKIFCYGFDPYFLDYPNFVITDFVKFKD